jgi:hypothetical protein
LAARNVARSRTFETIATVTDQTPIAAQGGWLAWSSPAGNGRYRLTAWHQGVTTTLPIKSYSAPFDVDLGTDGAGRVVATFSRCAVPPMSVGIQAPTSSGCSARVVDLASGVERSAGIPRPPGTSDNFPSMWHGQIAFARQDPQRHKDIDQVLLWSPRTRKVTVLPHGAVPSNCPFGKPSACAGAEPRGTVMGLDFSAGLVAFRWYIQAPAVVGHGGFEVRADRVADHRSVLVGSGYYGEVCTEGTDTLVPLAPVVDATRVWYAQLAAKCYAYTSHLDSYTTNPVHGESGPLDGTTLSFAKDGQALFTLTAPPNQPNTTPLCARADQPCTIQRVANPDLTPLSHAPVSPFFEAAAWPAGGGELGDRPWTAGPRSGARRAR